MTAIHTSRTAAHSAPQSLLQPAVGVALDTFERAGPDPVAAGQALAVVGKTHLEGTTFEPRSAVWVRDKWGYEIIVLSDEVDLADSLQRQSAFGKAKRLFMNVSPTWWGRHTGTLRGHIGFFQWPQGQEHHRSQVILQGRVTTETPHADSVTLKGTYRGRSMNDPSGATFAGEFNATRLDLSYDPALASNISRLAQGWRLRQWVTFTKTLSNVVVSVIRDNVSVRQAIAGVRIGPTADDLPVVPQPLGRMQALHALNALAWQALQKVCDFYAIGSDEFVLPRINELEGKFLWPTKARLLKKKYRELLQVIARRHRGSDFAIHFDDLQGPRESHRELYVSFKNRVKNTRWMIPGLFRKTEFHGPGNTLYVPMIGEYQDQQATLVDDLAAEGSTWAQRRGKLFVRERAGKFTAAGDASGS